MNSAKKISRLSKILKWATLMVMCGLPIFDAGYWITSGYPFLEPWYQIKMLPTFTDVSTPAFHDMSSLNKFCGFLATLIPTGVSMIALGFLAKLFHLYEQLEIFSRENVKCLRRLGFTLLIGQAVYSLIYFPLISLALTISNPPGHRTVNIAFSDQQLALAAIGLAIILISWIMEEGRKLQEEQAATV